MQFSITVPSVDSEDSRVYIHDEFYYTAIDFMYQGAKFGLTDNEVYRTLAVEMAIESGEMALPWSQAQCEENLATSPLEIQNTRRLMAIHPEFTQVACAWAYQQDPALFYRFNPAAIYVP